MLCLSGCGQEDAPAVVLPLSLHTLPQCDLPPELSRGNVELVSLGDFVASNDSAEILPLGRKGAALKFPVATRAVEARVGDGPQAFFGYAERRASALDLLLWPQLSTCVVARPTGLQGYPGVHGGQALGYSESAGLVLAAGGNDPLVSDAIEGALQLLDTSGDGVLRHPRAFATVTAFGDQLLVAGGEQPVFGVPEVDIEPQASAEVFDPKLGRFSGEQIQLENTRTHHAALTLSDGRTLLIGGRSKFGGTNIAQYQLETLDPVSRRASVGDTVTGRIDPRALRLSDGRIFVGGGVAFDGSLAQPLGEWLSVDARHDETQLSVDVAPLFGRAFVAMPGGGLLAVGGCEDRPALSEEDAKACALCLHGCPPAKYDAWWIARDGNAVKLTFDAISAPRPILLGGSDGSPWLVAADSSAPEEARLFRFNPWSERFEPASVPAGLRLPRPGMPQPLALGPDAFVWLDERDGRGELVGLRLGTRNRYAQDLALVLLSDPLDPTRPQHLVPDRAHGGASYDGALTLDGEVVVRVADTDYEDVTVKLHLLRGAPPLVLLGKRELGGADCPWPDGTASGGDFELATVARRRERVELRFHGKKTACPVPTGRLSLGVRASTEVSVITQIDVAREALAD